MLDHLVAPLQADMFTGSWSAAGRAAGIYSLGNPRYESQVSAVQAAVSGHGVVTLPTTR
jgi:hypothetical protein